MVGPLDSPRDIPRDGLVTFLPHRLNRHPVVVRGLTADELWVCAGLSAAAGFVAGVPLAWTGELLWTDLEHSRALWLLHHPRYSGACCFGRTRVRKQPDGSHRHQRLPSEEWIALIRDAHAGDITWDEYEENLRILRDNVQAPATGRDRGTPREGPALLQGLALCARCGDRMTVRYHVNGTRRVPDYVCQREGVEHAQPICQQIVGGELDAAIGRLLVEVVTPITLGVALAVQKEPESRSEDSDRLRRQAVERARCESDLARRRYMRCDPDNRLVADSLEAE